MMNKTCTAKSTTVKKEAEEDTGRQNEPLFPWVDKIDTVEGCIFESNIQFQCSSF